MSFYKNNNKQKKKQVENLLKKYLFGYLNNNKNIKVNLCKFFYLLLIYFSYFYPNLSTIALVLFFTTNKEAEMNNSNTVLAVCYLHSYKGI